MMPVGTCEDKIEQRLRCLENNANRPTEAHRKDVDFNPDYNHLIWIHSRLVGHGENPSVDYMVRLKEIAEKINRSVTNVTT